MPSLIGNKPNQVPSNGDLGTLAFQDANAVNITGGAISGNIASTGINIDSNTLVIDATNNRVGVGTASPTQALDVVGSISASGNLTIGAGTGSKFLNFNTSTGSYILGQISSANTYLVGDTGTALGSGTGYITYVYGANPVIWYNNSVGETMRITGTGNVGIGTSSPGYKLHISGSSPTLMVQDTGANASQAFIQATNSGNYFGCSTSGGTTQPMLFYVGTERMRLDSSGNLGLGVTPSAWGGGFKTSEYLGGFIGSQASNYLWAGANNYYNGSSYIYKTSNQASLYGQNFGGHYWYNAPSGTAGNAITFTQAMTLDASGRLGIGTTSPNKRLTVAAEDTTNTVNGSAGLQIVNTNAGAAGRMTSVTFGGRAPSNFPFAAIAGILESDVAQEQGGHLAFYTKSTTTAANPAERMRIDSSGNLLIGKTGINNTVNGVELRADGQTYATLAATTNAAQTLHVFSSGATAYRFYVGMGGTVYATSTTITGISDQRLKENIVDLDVGLNAVMALKPRKFDWKAGKGKDIKGDRGFIAQEFETVFPDLIDEWKDPAPEGEEPYKAVRADLIPVLVKAIQEQQAIINDLKARIETLESK
jgi:hypothetical protein